MTSMSNCQIVQHQMGNCLWEDELAEVNQASYVRMAHSLNAGPTRAEQVRRTVVNEELADKYHLRIAGVQSMVQVTSLIKPTNRTKPGRGMVIWQYRS